MAHGPRASASLFVVIDAALRHGLEALLTALSSAHGSGRADLCASAASARWPPTCVNNLPAYLALEPVASADPRRGCGPAHRGQRGPLVTMWASLATLLWA